MPAPGNAAAADDGAACGTGQLGLGTTSVRARTLWTSVSDWPTAAAPGAIIAAPHLQPETAAGSDLQRVPAEDIVRHAHTFKADSGGGTLQASSSAPSLQELKNALPDEPEQCHPSPAAVSRTAPWRRYPRSKAGWASKERSTPEGYKREEHAWRFESPHPPGISTSSITDAYEAAFGAPVVVRPPKIKKSPEERNAIREERIAQRERASLRHIETALRKYNRANSTKFELVEITVKCMFFEFGGPGYHYNFTAKPGNHHSAGDSVKLFFAEINCPLQSERDVLVCCIVGKKDAGHCYACKNYRPTMVHPSSQAYGGGNTTAIDYPDSDSSSSDDAD